MFDFRLLQSIPRPTGSSLLCVLLFVCLACPYWLGQPGTTPEALHGTLHDFLRDEHSEKPKHPQILIAGSSLSGMAFHVGELERRMGMRSAKISLSGSTAADMLDILECYPEETRHARVAFLELIPARLTDKQDMRRKRFFDEIRGVKNIGSDTMIRFLRRSSMPRFVGRCLKPLHYVKKTLERRRLDLPPPLYFYEDKWDDPTYRADKEKDRIACRHLAEQIRRSREHLIEEQLPLMVKTTQQKGKIVYDDEQFEAVYRFVDLCRSRGIFVVICVMPQWYGQLNFTQNNLEKPTEDIYLSLLQDLNGRPDCTVIICRDFEEITNVGTDEDYLFDYGHMTREGAIVYTNWLADRLQESHKTAAGTMPLQR